MLKIAEYNKITGEKVALSELENFGFIKKQKYYRFENITVDISTRYLLIQSVNRNQYGDSININSFNSTMIFINSKLYDLIQAGLVEKE